MRRQLILILIGAAVLATDDLAAQRAQNRAADRGARSDRVERLDPVRANGRIAPRTVYRGGRFDRRSRVVYSSRSRYPAYRRGPVRVRASWGRVRMRPLGYHYRRTFLNQSDLREILGRRTVDRVRDSGRRAGLHGSPRGRWVEQRGYGRLLVISMSRVDVAEFADHDGDGFVDESFLIGASPDEWIAYGS